MNRRLTSYRIWLALPVVLLSSCFGIAAEAPRKGPERVVFNTASGDIVFALYPDVAPRHVRQFLKLVGEGVYDTTYFGRLEPGFVLQLYTAEDRRVPLSQRERDMLQPIKAEFSDLPHRRGILSMARLDDDPDSGCSSFSILLGPAPHLDHKYTVFGEVERGMDVVDEICKVPVDGTRPKMRVEVRKAIVVPDVAQLADIHLVPARAFEGPPEVSASAASALTPSGPALAGGLVLIVACGVASFALANRLPGRVIMSLVLINVLIGSFFLLMLLTPAAQTSSLLAVAVFAGMLATFKMMSRFESAA
jgi:peptidyl-prolyl cis-trans isomerase B (cyclophilin B)